MSLLDLGVEEYHPGVHDKSEVFLAFLQRSGLNVSEVCYMGDDLPDLPVLRAVGFAVAPASVHHWIRDAVHWVTPSRGGEGAARELCDLVLHAQGRVEALLRDDAR